MKELTSGYLKKKELEARSGIEHTHAYTHEEVCDIMDAVGHHTLQAALMVLTFTGLQLEELKGLRWSDYDTENGVLNIQRTVVFGKVIEDTKTTSNKAPVPVVGIVKTYLDAHLKRNSGTGFIFHALTDPERPINFAHLVWDVVIPNTTSGIIFFHTSPYAAIASAAAAASSNCGA